MDEITVADAQVRQYRKLVQGEHLHAPRWKALDPTTKDFWRQRVQELVNAGWTPPPPEPEPKWRVEERDYYCQVVTGYQGRDKMVASVTYFGPNYAVNQETAQHLAQMHADDLNSRDAESD